MKRKLNKFAMTVVGSAALMAGTPAHAICDGCVTGAVTAAGVAITTAVATTTTAVVALNTSMVMYMTYVLQGIKASSSAIGQVVKETGTIQAETAIRVATTDALRDADRRYAVTDPCAIGAPSAGVAETIRQSAMAGESFGRGGTAGARAGAGGSLMPDASGKLGAGDVRKQLSIALDIAEGKRAAPAPDIAAAIAASSACGSFVGSDAASQQRRQACQDAGFTTGNLNTHPSADISAKTLFDGPQKQGEARKKFTIDNTKDSDEERAVSAFLRNMNTPLELRSLKGGELNTVAGRRYMAVKDIFDARMSMAERPMRRHVGLMSQNVATIPAVKDMALADPFVAQYLSKNAPNWATKGVSADEVLNLDVERRYMNLKWLASTVSMTPEEVTREQLRLSALQNVLLWRLNQETRENGILLGALVGSNVRVELMPEMKAAHAASTR